MMEIGGGSISHHHHNMNNNVSPTKMEPLIEVDEDAISISAAENNRSSCVSSGVSDFDEPNSTAGEEPVKIPALDKYNLRTKSIQNRIEVEKKRKSPKPREPKPKQRPAPLSKYRRKTANLRERSRMQEINDAFEELRSAVPQLPVDENVNANLTKITTLRLAVNYIAALTKLLNETEPTSNEQHHQQSMASKNAEPLYATSASTLSPTLNQHQSIGGLLSAHSIGPLTSQHPNQDQQLQQHQLPSSNLIGGDPALNSLGSTLDFDLTASLTDGDLVSDLHSDLESSFMVRQDISNRPSSCTSSDFASSYHSPSTSDRESLESYTSAACGWGDFDDASLGDVDQFDLILESDGEAAI